MVPWCFANPEPRKRGQRAGEEIHLAPSRATAPFSRASRLRVRCEDTVALAAASTAGRIRTPPELRAMNRLGQQLAYLSPPWQAESLRRGVRAACDLLRSHLPGPDKEEP